MAAASLTDILTTLQNGVKSLNTAIQTALGIYGAQSAATITAATLVSTTANRLATISITTAGSANGAIYDSNALTNTTLPIFTIPQTIGVIFINLPVTNGILVVPGTGQVVTVSWS
jgi:hypothetical protein